LPGDTPAYHITMLHGEDDYDIPWSHSEQLYWHAVNASLPQGINYDDLEEKKLSAKRNLGRGGWSMTWRTEKGTLTEKILRNGLHDVIMSYPVVSLAILDAFQQQ
jgi:abhydrolase domain-containing protein 12